MGRGFVDVEGSGDGGVAHGHDHLDDTGHAGRHLGVADVGLDRAQEQGPLAVLAVGGQEGLGLDGVAELGTGAVAVHDVDVGRGHAGVGEGLADDALLRGPVGGGQSVGGAVLVDGAAADDREDLVAVAQGVGEALDEHQADAFGEAHAVGGLGVGLAAAVGRHGALAAEADEGVGRGHDAHAAGQGEGALAVAQRLARQVQGDQRRRAGGVEGDRRPFETEGVGQAAGQDAGDGAGDQVSLGALGARPSGCVVLVAGSDEGAGQAAAEGGGVDAGPLQGLPGGFEQQALLRVHREGLAGRDAEESGVEVRHVVEESAAGGVRLAGPVGVRVVQSVGVPAPVEGELGDGVAARGDEVPQLFGGADAARVAAAHADDGDGLVAGGRADRRRGLGARAGDLAAQVLHEREGVGVVEHHGARQGQPRHRGQPVAQVHGGEGVEADVAEGPLFGEDVGRGVAEDRRGLRADQVEQGPVLLDGGQGEEPGDELAVRGGGGGLLLQPLDVGDVLEQRGGPPGGEDRVVALPVDVGDRQDGLVVVEGLSQSGQGQLRVHEHQAAAADLRRVDPAELDVVGPDAPRDGRRAGAAGAAVLRERVEVGVGGDVGGVRSAAPHAGGGGVQDEGVELVVEEFVEVAGALDLGVDDLGEGVEAGLGERCQFDDGGGVDDGADGVPVGLEPVEEARDRVPVGQVAGDDGGFAALLGELLDEFGGAGGVHAPAAGQDDVPGALLDEPARQVGRQRAGAAGDQGGAPRRPGAGRGGVGGGGAHDAPGEDARGADGQLVLAGAAGEDGRQSFAGAPVELLGQVDQTAPALRVFQRRRPAQAVDLGLDGPGQPVRAARGDRAARQAPQGRVDAGVSEGLDEGDGQGQPPGQLGVQLAGCLVVREQRDHSRERGGVRRVAELGQSCGQGGPVEAGVVEQQAVDVRPVRGQCGFDVSVGDAGGGDDQPGAGQCRGGQAAERLPCGAVAPGVHGGAVAAATAPVGECGKDGCEGGSVDAQAGGQGFDVLLLDGGPELAVRRVRFGLGARLGGDGPQVFALEGVRGQVDPSGAAVGEDPGPVRAHAPDEGFGEGGQEPVGAALVAPERPEHGRPASGVLHGGLDAHGQHRVGADLDEHPVFLAEQFPDRRLEAHGLAQVAVPVPGVEGGGVEPVARHRREERHLGGLRPHRGEGRQQFVTQQLDLGGVRGVVHRDPPGADVLGGQCGHQALERLRCAGDDDRARSVDGGDGDVAVEGAQALLDLGGRQRHRHHAAGSGQHAGDGLAAQGHDARRVLQRQRSGDGGRGDLALGVADHGVRGNPVGAPECGQGDHDGERGGLDDVDTVQGGSALGLAEHVDERPVDERRQRGRALVQALGEDRGLLQQACAHSQPLRALAGEDEDDLAVGIGRAVDGGGRRLAGGQGPQLAQELVGARADDHRAVVEDGTGGDQGVADVGRPGLRGGLEMGGEAGGLGAQGAGRARGQHPREGAGRSRLRGGGLLFLLARCLFEDRVGVGAADAEGGDRAAARPLPFLPVEVLGQQGHRAGRPVDVGGRLVGVQGARQGAVPHRHDHLDHTGDARRRLGVTDVGLDRAQQQRALRVAVLAVGGLEGLGFDGVAERGAGAVRLHDVDVRRGEARVGQGLPDDALLRGAVGGGEPVRSAVLVDGGAADHGEDLVAVAAGVGEALQDEDAHALGEGHAVGGLGEGLATAVLRECALPAEDDERVGVGHDGRAAGQGEGALAVAQRLARQVQRHQGRGAGRVHGDRGAFQPEQVGQAPGQDAGAGAGDRVAGEAVVEAEPVLLVGRADERAGRAAVDGDGVDAGLFKGLPGGFQQQALLGVHRQRFTRRDAEEAGVELARVVQEAALGGVRLAGLFGVRVVQVRAVPAAIDGEVADGVHAFGHQLPELLG